VWWFIQAFQETISLSLVHNVVSIITAKTLSSSQVHFFSNRGRDNISAQAKKRVTQLTVARKGTLKNLSHCSFSPTYLTSMSMLRNGSAFRSTSFKIFSYSCALLNSCAYRQTDKFQLSEQRGLLFCARNSADNAFGDV